ncbi:MULTISPECIES: phage GP46 family protein [unclassified Pseudomonas]|uniref:phage GP46 family protein n=1 Tax=unclassified Pseudomonas TaxID=196821 RepID=UPI00128BF2AA|nr:MULTISPECIES: phage GP46 family protein [unclassified Pseudomonas]MPQ67805.1 hypothetical protein [Pseudomonas sp. MWU12-2323]
MLNSDNLDRAWHRAAVISLLTWRRAGPDDPLDDNECHGWWGDSFPTLANDRIGSRLWLLRRRSLTAQTQRDAEDYARESLAWMLEDDRITDIAVTSRRGPGRLDLHVVLSQRHGDPITITLDNLWLILHAF